MSENTLDRALRAGRKQSLLGESELRAIDGEVLQRETEKTKIISAFMARIHYDFDSRLSEKELDGKFLATVRDLLEVDGAALLLREKRNGDFRLRSSSGLPDPAESVFHPDFPPATGSVELYSRNAEEPENAIDRRLAALAGTSNYNG